MTRYFFDNNNVPVEIIEVADAFLEGGRVSDTIPAKRNSLIERADASIGYDLTSMFRGTVLWDEYAPIHGVAVCNIVAGPNKKVE